MSTALVRSESLTQLGIPTAGSPEYGNLGIDMIPSGWFVASVGALFDFLRTAANSRADLGDEGTVAYVHYGDIHTRFHHFIDFYREILPSLSENKSVRASRLRDGDLIVADASEDESGVGKSVEVCNLGEVEAVAGLHTLLLRSKDLRVVDGFRGYLLETAPAKRQLRQLATGLKVFGISKSALRTVHILLPPPTEQCAIAEALSDLDGVLSALETLIAKKCAIKQAAMQQLLTGKTRLPGFSGEWETKRLGELGAFAKGRGIRREDISSEGFPCVLYGELYTRYYNYTWGISSHISREIAQRALPIKAGDILFAGSGETAEDIGRCASYLGNEEAYAGGDIIVLRPTGQDSIYLGHLLNHPTVQAQKARMGQGNAVVHISTRNLAQIQINLPRLKEQSAISAVLSDMDSEIAGLERRRDKVGAIKQGMMQELLTGKIRLVDQNAIAEASSC